MKERAYHGELNAQWELYKHGKRHGHYYLNLIRNAAQHGDYRAQCELGYIYCYGLYGVGKNLILSLALYMLVEAEGCYCLSGADYIREQLTPEATCGSKTHICSDDEEVQKIAM